MILNLTKDFHKELKHHETLKDIDFVKAINSDWKNETVQGYINLLSSEEFNQIKELAIEKDSKVAKNIKRIEAILNNPSEMVKPTNLNDLVQVMLNYIMTDSINGWVFKKVDDYELPYLITNITYTPYQQDNPAYVRITGVYNSHESTNSSDAVSWTLYSGDIKGKTIRDIFNFIGFKHETPELIEQYEKELVLYKDVYNHTYKQYTAKKLISESGRYHSRRDKIINTNLSYKVIMEEPEKNRKFKSVHESSFWDVQDLSDIFFKIPVHCITEVFILDLHTRYYTHVNDLVLYEYDTKINEKIVLPDYQKDLIDVLVNDFDVLSSDIVKGKSGGTSILCIGGPGLGKTLSAEIYSENSQRPLYKVHSGQLGLTSDAVEENLKQAFRLVTKWNAILLIDEADIFIRERGDDMGQNAVVASFLRVMEYFDGLLFMTSNRVNDIDDAILSRCIAVIKYELPDLEGRINIWNVLSKQFKAELSNELINHLASVFNKTSGRDIKELLKLTARYVKSKEIEFDVDVFIKCSQFKRVSINNEYYNKIR